ncbi:uncharacterized protein LOC122307492 [Carya illinoinensis]|uniref:uncharacterized protein LOC122307492 n=1 Tax=Carya illinoinensis TaxID=32201 RepID=UPI001C725AF3|nr:uncharacterized protein LOC122307492 [Carya illinoinensis]
MQALQQAKEFRSVLGFLTRCLNSSFDLGTIVCILETAISFLYMCLVRQRLSDAQIRSHHRCPVSKCLLHQNPYHFLLTLCCIAGRISKVAKAVDQRVHKCHIGFDIALEIFWSSVFSMLVLSSYLSLA